MQNHNHQLSFNGKNITLSLLENETTSPTTVVFLHGLQTSKGLYEEWLNSSFFEKYHCIAIDLVGFGDSDKPENGFSYSIEEQAAIIQSFLKDRGIKQFHLVGHSMGGMIGTLLLELLPESVQSLVSMEGNLQLEDCGESANVASMSFEQFSEFRFPALKNELKGSDVPSAEFRHKSVSKVPDRVFFQTATEVVETAKSERLYQIFETAPHSKLLLIGLKSGFSSRPLNERNTIVELDGATHFMTLDKPEESFFAVTDFIGRMIQNPT